MKVTKGKIIICALVVSAFVLIVAIEPDIASQIIEAVSGATDQ